MRVHLFEFEDLTWFPEVIRSGGTDYLRYFLNATKLYEPTIGIIKQTLEETGEPQIIDLCSGGGGYIESIHDRLASGNQNKLSIILTDKFPNVSAFQVIAQRTNGEIKFINEPVDALNVPGHLTGLRVMFSAIHHFQPSQVRGVLQNAVDARSPIAIFDGGDKNIFTFLGMILFHPIAFLLFTPFFKPFKLSRIFFTYILPLIPIYTVWDGCVSILRMYTTKELINIARETGDNSYNWKVGKIKNKFGLHAIFLVGIPERNL